MSGGASASGGGTASGGTNHSYDHCLYGYEPEPVDPSWVDGPAEYYPPGNSDPAIVDLTVQPYVLDWLTAHNWQTVHVEWHAIRTCGIGSRGLGSKIGICDYTALIPTDQNCQTGGDGYQFLLMHRHMIQALKQLWPNHTEQFTGFTKFPRTAEDVPPQWRSAFRPWSEAALANGVLGDEIEKPENLAKFPDEGALGFWLQCTAGAILPNRPDALTSGGVHFDLHAKWVRPGNTRHGVGNNDANIDNYMFWKLHGWIDNVWEKYRVAKGLTQEDPKYKSDLEAQCREMDTLEAILLKDLDPEDVPGPIGPLPVESGFFHEQVRPILESAKNGCSGCHAETGPTAGLSLGGQISSKDIVDGLVGVASVGGGQFQRVVPGDADASWLYLKASGRAAQAGCSAANGGMCVTSVMPPASDGQPTLGAGELEILRRWIEDGAEGPP